MIRIAPLTDEPRCTLEIFRLLDSGIPLVLQSDQHPYAGWLKDAGYPYVTMDDAYASAEDYPELFDRISDALIERGDVLYLYIGYPFDLLEVLECKAGERHLQVASLSGVGDVRMAFADRRIDGSFPASGILESFDPDLSYVFTEIDTFFRASHLKEKLLEYYPPTQKIETAKMENGSYVRRSVQLYELDRMSGYDSTLAVYLPPVPFEQRSRFGIRDLEYVLDRLRAPDGCPWDKVQTHQTIRNDFLEESYEVAEAIDKNDMDALCEELGDVLMHIVFHASIGKQYSEFTFRDVVTDIVRKMVFRHPHVFGEANASTPEEVLANWDVLKKEEKHYGGLSDEMSRIPACLPALVRAKKIQKKAAKIGFDFESAGQALLKISEESDELTAAMRSGKGIEEEYGDLLFSIVNVGRLLKLEPEEILQRANEKFVTRISRMEQLAAEAGRTLENMDPEQMEQLWEAGKKLV